MATVWINYTPGKEYLDYALTKNNGQVISIEKNVAYKTLSEIARDSKVKVNIIISSPDITLRKVMLPKKYDGMTLKKILPNMLEEELLTSIDETSYSYGKQSEDNSVLCAVLSNDFIKSVAKHFEQHKIYIDSICPILGLFQEDRFKKPVLINNNQDLILMPANYSGFILDLDLFNVLFSKNLYELVDPKIPIDQFKVFDQKNEIWSFLSFVTPEFQFLIHNPTKLNVENARFKIIKLLGTWFVFCCILILIRGGIVYDNYSKQSSDLDIEINKLYKKIIPNATGSLDPRIRIESELKKRAGNNGIESKGFLNLMYAFSNSREQITRKYPHEEMTILSFQYKNNKLKISFLVKNNEYIQELKKYIDSEYSVNENSVKKTNQFYQVELEIAKK